MLARAALVLAMVLTACGPASLPDAPTESAPPGQDPTPAEAVDEGGAPPTPDAGAEPEEAPSDPEPPKLEIVLAGRPIQAYALGETHLFTLESDVRTRLVATEKAPPHAVKVILEEDILDGVRFEGVGAARGRVFVSDSYGATRSLLPNGTGEQHEYVPGAPTRILSAPKTLWFADLPRFLGDILTFQWLGANPEDVPYASRNLVPTGAVGDVAVDDVALVYGTRGAAPALRQWMPAGSGAQKGHHLLASLPEEARAIALDGDRVYAHLPTAQKITSYDRATGTEHAVLSGFTFDTQPFLRSDGKNLYLLTETALRRCAIASCAGTMTTLATGLVAARSLTLDGAHAFIVMVPKGKTGVVARVKK